MTAHPLNAPRLNDRLVTDRLVLRHPTLADYGPFREFAESLRARFVGGPTDTASQSWGTFAAVAGQWVLRGYGLYVLEDRASGAAVGACGCWHPAHWHEPELAWQLWSKSHERRGLIREAALAIRAHLYDRLGWDTLVSYIDPANARSIACARALGCREDAVARRPEKHALVFRHPGAPVPPSRLAEAPA